MLLMGVVPIFSHVPAVSEYSLINTSAPGGSVKIVNLEVINDDNSLNLGSLEIYFSAF